MSESAPELVVRVGTLIGDYRTWFEIVAQWYRKPRSGKTEVLRLWAPTIQPSGRPSLSVNGKFLEDGSRDRRSSAHHLFWILPPSLLQVGDNDIILWIERKAEPALTFGTVTVEHATALPKKVRQESRPAPPPSTQVSVTFRLGEDFRQHSDRWQVQIHHDTLKFHLHLAERVPGNFTVGVAALLPGGEHALDLEVIWKIIDDWIEDKIQQLAKDLLRQQARGQQRLIEANLDDLKGYQKLHRTQLREAVQGPDGLTLQEVIDRTARPADLIQSVRTHVRVRGMSALAKFCLLLVLVGALGAIAWANGWIDRNTPARVEVALRQWWQANPGQRGQRERENQIAEILKEKGAQTGDVQVSLFWTNKNDLDLHVVPPSGEEVYYGHRESKCKGRLDVDMNVGYAGASIKAVENVFWPVNAAPKGRYRILVKHFRNHGQPDCQDPTPFTVRLIVRGETRWFHGEAVHEDRTRNLVLVNEFEVR